jgi:hypothetical protein
MAHQRVAAVDAQILRQIGLHQRQRRRVRIGAVDQ